MATYFPVFRPRPRPQQPESQEVPPPRLESRASASQPVIPTGPNQGIDHMESESMFIFPAPSSVPQTPINVSIPHSPATGSLSSLSLPTSMSVGSGSISLSGPSTPSYVRRLRLRAPRGEETAAGGTALERNGRGGTIVYGQGGLGLANLDVGLESASESSEGDGLDVEVEVWEWSSVNVSSRGSQVDPNSPHSSFPLSDNRQWQQQPYWLPTHLRTRTISQFTNASNTSALSYFSHSTTPLPNLVPELPIHFPLLTWIRRLLKIDDDTLLLLGVGGCSGGESTLFASTPFDLSKSTPSTVAKDEEKSNPVIALLISDDTHAVHHLRAGMRAAAEEKEGPVPGLDPFQISLRTVMMSPITLASSAATGAFRLTSNVATLSSSALSSFGTGWLRQSTV